MALNLLAIVYILCYLAYNKTKLVAENKKQYADKRGYIYFSCLKHFKFNLNVMFFRLHESLRENKQLFINRLEF